MRKRIQVLAMLLVSSGGALAETEKAGGGVLAVPPPPPVSVARTEPEPTKAVDFADEVQATSLTKDEIRKLKIMAKGVQRAAAEPVELPPKPETGMQLIDLAPGASPPVIRLSENEGSTLVFLDSSGAPWPIQNFENFASKIATVKKPLEGGHILTADPKAPFGYGNLTVFLLGLPTPVSMTLLAGQRAVDYRVDIRIPKHFNQIVATSSTGGQPGGVVSQQPATDSSYSNTPIIDPIMSDVLSNTVVESDAKKILSKGGDVLAWLRSGKKGQTLLIRTAGIMLSPAPLDGGKATSSDGTNAYEIRVSPVITILLNGKPVSVVLDIKT